MDLIRMHYLYKHHMFVLHVPVIFSLQDHKIFSYEILHQCPYPDQYIALILMHHLIYFNFNFRVIIVVLILIKTLSIQQTVSFELQLPFSTREELEDDTLTFGMHQERKRVRVWG